MTDTKKTRAPRQMTEDEIAKQINGLPFEKKMSLYAQFKDHLEKQKAEWTKQIELLNESL